jgi:hypothetical protein
MSAPRSITSHKDGTKEEDDRWHAAYLQSLMNKAGELSVRGMYSIFGFPVRPTF